MKNIVIAVVLLFFPLSGFAELPSDGRTATEQGGLIGIMWSVDAEDEPVARRLLDQQTEGPKSGPRLSQSAYIRTLERASDTFDASIPQDLAESSRGE